MFQAKSGDVDDLPTPYLTPMNSEAARTTAYPDPEHAAFQSEYEATIMSFMRELQGNGEQSCTPPHHEYESGTESDAQDQQATEAADSDLPIESHKDPVDTNIDQSLHPEPCASIVPSTISETEAVADNLAVVISSVDILSEEKSISSSPLTCRESLCVPYTNKEGESNDGEILFQEVMTTSSVIVDDPGPKKNKNDLGHIMISYNHSTRLLCMKIAHCLRDLDYLVWIDHDNITGNVVTAMASAVENAFVILMAVNEQYFRSRYCRLEAEFAMERNKALVPMLMQADYNPGGWLGLIKGAKLHVDFVQLPFDQAFNLLIREIETVRRNLTETNDDCMNSCTAFQSQTTVNYSFPISRRVQEWTTDEVMDWLHRERLEIFQHAFARFTGETLYQFYKIRLDCPAYYFQTVESLLDSTVSLRLFYSLSLNGALESLFSSTPSSFPFQNKH